jgi:glycosyltransferase involved in cell wall biosynthesis
MRIAQFAPLLEAVPPRGYGGTERVVFWLTEELVRQGHQVTLFASGDSRTSAELVPGCARALRHHPESRHIAAHYILMLERLWKRRADFEIVHFHTDYLHFPLTREGDLNHVTTLHGRLDDTALGLLYKEFCEVPVVSISKEQRGPLPHANWVGNVYHGLPGDLLSFHPGAGKYLAFIGRISPEKRPDRAIAIANQTGMELRIAAKVDAEDRRYFESQIKPLLDRPNIQFLGEIGDRQKGDFLGNALACLAPIDWPEPFGLNMIEAMACGTPTIAFRQGSVPEIIEDGVSGLIVQSVEEAVEAVARVGSISRRACRNAFERRFTARRMAEDYLRIYEQVSEQRIKPELPLYRRSAIATPDTEQLVGKGTP